MLNVRNIFYGWLYFPYFLKVGAQEAELIGFVPCTQSKLTGLHNSKIVTCTIYTEFNKKINFNKYICVPNLLETFQIPKINL